MSYCVRAAFLLTTNGENSMKFMEALDHLQDKNCLGIYRTTVPNRIVTWNKSNFKDFYTGKSLYISKSDLFSDSWELFKSHHE